MHVNLSLKSPLFNEVERFIVHCHHLTYSVGDFNSPGVIRGVRFAPFENVNEGWLRTSGSLLSGRAAFQAFKFHELLVVSGQVGLQVGSSIGFCP